MSSLALTGCGGHIPKVRGAKLISILKPKKNNLEDTQMMYGGN